MVGDLHARTTKKFVYKKRFEWIFFSILSINLILDFLIMYFQYKMLDNPNDRQDVEFARAFFFA